MHFTLTTALALASLGTLTQALPCTSTIKSMTSASTSTTIPCTSSLTTSESTSTIPCSTTSSTSISTSFPFTSSSRTLASTSTISWRTISTSTTHCTTPTPPPPPNPTPIKPSKDPWYAAPCGFQYAKPGTVLASRPMPGDISRVMPDAKSAWNIIFATTDSHYQPTWAVTTLFVPKNRNPVPAMLSYQVPYDSVNIDSSPGYGIFSGQKNDLITLEDWVFMVVYGWYVNIPDYEGPHASFAAGVTSGHAVLDSIRASLSFGKEHLNMPQETKYAIWGYSGGAFASEWAAELQVQYAPEMDFAATILGGLTPNISNVLTAIDNTTYSRLIPAAMVGLSTQYPQVAEFLKQNLVQSGEYNAATFMSITNMNYNEMVRTFDGKEISNYFINGMSSLMSSPVVREAIYHDGIMGYHGVPQMPLYVYESVKDEVSPINDTRKLLCEYANMGARIEYHENTICNGTHASEGVSPKVNGNALKWLSDIFSDATTISPGNCTAIQESFV